MSKSDSESTDPDVDANGGTELQEISLSGSESWDQRALQLVVAEDDELKRDFIDTVMDRLLLNCIRSGSATIHVQDGLNWTMNDAEIVEEFKHAVDTWQMYAPANGNYGDVHVDIGGRIVDTATITNTPDLGSFQKAPRAETQTTVDVFLEFSCVFSPRGNHWKAHFTVQQPQ